MESYCARYFWPENLEIVDSMSPVMIVLSTCFFF